jgi:hypothetical protein
MNGEQRDPFESELSRLQPARFPEHFSVRLAAAEPVAGRPAAGTQPRASRMGFGLRALRWCAPAAAAVGLAFLAARLHPRASQAPGATPPSEASAALRADHVEIDRQLIGTFNAIATLPGGEPVLVQCREWMDDVVLRDTRRGVAIQQRTPRFEVIPVRLETF